MNTLDTTAVLRLFYVTMDNGKPLKANGSVIYFDKKFQAKAFRDSIEEGATISRGPDHWKETTVTTVTTVTTATEEA